MDIIIYSKPNCNWCVKAKELMNKLQLNYDEKVLDVDYTREYLRVLLYGANPQSDILPLTVPQIFINAYRVGGYEEFVEYLDERGMNIDGK